MLVGFFVSASLLGLWGSGRGGVTLLKLLSAALRARCILFVFFFFNLLENASSELTKW